MNLTQFRVQYMSDTSTMIDPSWTSWWPFVYDDLLGPTSQRIDDLQYIKNINILLLQLLLDLTFVHERSKFKHF